MKDMWTDGREATSNRSHRYAVRPHSHRCAHPTHSQNQIRHRYALYSRVRHFCLTFFINIFQVSGALLVRLFMLINVVHFVFPKKTVSSPANAIFETTF